MRIERGRLSPIQFQYRGAFVGVGQQDANQHVAL